MPLQFLGKGMVRTRRAKFPDPHGAGDDCGLDAGRIAEQAEADLPPSGQLDIDLGEQLRIEQGAMLDALAAVDAETCAERIETVLGPGMLGAGERQSVDHARGDGPPVRATPRRH